MATIGTLAVNLIARTSVFDRKMRASRRGLKTFTGQAALAQKKLLAFAKATVGIAAVGYAVVKAGRSFLAFEKQMAMVSTMLDEQTMKLMPQYTRQIQEMAMEFGEGTETLAKGLYDILSASVAPAKAMKVLAISVKAAKAGITDTAVAADAITTIINSYGLSADRAGDVSDKLFAIVKRGKLTFMELAPNIGKVAALANVAGLSFDELGAAVATLTRAGLQADLATTSLRSIMTQMIKPTDDAKKAAAAFGLELSSTTLRTIGLTGVLMKLRGATAEQLAVILPNVRGLAGFAAALKQVEKQADDLQLMLHSAGQTQKAFEKTTAITGHSLSQFGQAFKMLGIEIVTFVEPVLKPAIEGLTSVFRGLRLELIGLIEKIEELNLKSRWGEFIKDIKATGAAVSELGRDPLLFNKIGDIPERFLGAFGRARIDLELQGMLPAKFPAITMPARTEIKAQEVGKGIEIIAEVATKAQKRVEFLTAAIDKELAIIGRLNETRERSRDLVELQLAAEEAYGKGSEKTIKILAEYDKKLQQLRLAQMAQEIGESFARSFEDIVLNIKSVSDALKDLAMDIARLLMRRMITEPLAASIGAGLSGLIGATVAHGGGVVGQIASRRNVPALAFAGAPRLHGGLGPNEFAAVLDRGETVVPKGGGYPNVTVNINNQTSAQMKAGRQDVSFDGERMIVDIIVKDYHQGGKVRDIIKETAV